MTIPDSPATVDPAKANRPRAGRPFDRSKDAAILEATLDLLADRDFDRVTLEDVAARTGVAKTTLYRRWATKEDLVLAAIRSVGRPPEIDDPPDLGSLRAELLAVVDSAWLGGSARRLAIFASLASAARSSPSLAEVVRSEATEPYIEIYRRLLTSAVDRGEIAADLAPRIPILAEVVPAMSTHGLSRGPEFATRDFFVQVIDDVVLAALGVSA